MNEMTLSKLMVLPESSYMLVDIRDEGSVLYGMIPGAVNIPMDEILSDPEACLNRFPKNKRIIFYCRKGVQSVEVAERIGSYGYECFSLEGGYSAYLMESIRQKGNDAERQKKAEDSLRHKYHEQIFTPFVKACKNYELIKDGDHIAVCMSGGKDSVLMAKMFQEIQRHRKFNFELTFLVMDPGYNRENRELLESNAKMLGIPITIFESRIFDAVDKIDKSPCYLCARMRRGHLYSEAKKLGCNKIALGHHYDDVIETILMGMLHGGQIQSMMPKLHSTNFEGMELIRPLYLIREADICKWRDYNDLHFLQCACHFTETCSTCHEDGTTSSKRLETKKLIAKLKETNPFIESNIFKSVENVNLDTMISYKKKGVKHSFLEDYDA